MHVYVYKHLWSGTPMCTSLLRDMCPIACIQACQLHQCIYVCKIMQTQMYVCTPENGNCTEGPRAPLHPESKGEGEAWPSLEWKKGSEGGGTSMIF